MSERLRDGDDIAAFYAQGLERDRLAAVMIDVRNLSKSFYRAVESGDDEKARQIRDESQREYNKAATKGVIHPNRAARAG